MILVLMIATLQVPDSPLKAVTPQARVGINLKNGNVLRGKVLSVRREGDYAGLTIDVAGEYAGMRKRSYITVRAETIKRVEVLEAGLPYVEEEDEEADPAETEPDPAEVEQIRKEIEEAAAGAGKLPEPAKVGKSAKAGVSTYYFDNSTDYAMTVRVTGAKGTFKMSLSPRENAGMELLDGNYTILCSLDAPNLKPAALSREFSEEIVSTLVSFEPNPPGKPVDVGKIPVKRSVGK